MTVIPTWRACGVDLLSQLPGAVTRVRHSELNETPVDRIQGASLMSESKVRNGH